MRMLSAKVSSLVIGALALTGGCGPSSSNPLSSKNAQVAQAEPRTNEFSRAPEPSSGGNSSTNEEELEIEGYPVESDVPRDVVPLIEKYLALTRECFRLDRQALCDAGDKVSDQILARHVCLGRFDDRLDREALRIRTWHVCGETSIWTAD